MDGSSDLDSLVAVARAGDRVALEALLGQVRPRVFGYVLARLADAASAEDVTQEVAMTIVSALPRYVDTGRPVMAWVFGIAIRKVSEAHRAMARRRECLVDVVPDAIDLTTTGQPEPASLRLETTYQMLALLDGLPHPQGEILRLRIASGLSADETAAALDMTPGAVRVAQHRALRRLRSTLASEALR